MNDDKCLSCGAPLGRDDDSNYCDDCIDSLIGRENDIDRERNK